MQILSLEDLVEYLDKTYPNKMVMDDISDFERVKMIGEQVVIQNIKRLIGDGYGSN